MTKYVLTGTQPLEFPDLRVEPSEDGTVFEYELDPVKEASLKHCIRRLDPEEKAKKGGR